MAHGFDDAEIEQLDSILRTHWNDEEVLKDLLTAIQGRVGADVRELRGKILGQLARLHAGPLKSESRVPDREPRMRSPDTVGLPPAPPQEAHTGSGAEVPSSADRCERYIAALEALIRAQRSSLRRKRRDVRNGVRSRITGDTTVYAFEIDSQSGIFDGTEVDLEIPGHRVAGTILSLQPGHVVLSCQKDLGQRIDRATLLFDDTRLLKQLAEKLRGVSRGELKLNRALADAALGGPVPLQQLAEVSDHGPKLPLNDSQAEARRRVLVEPVTFIWGPPGCGKTYTLSEIVRTLFEAGKRILICSNTNKAVDQVFLGICRTLGTDHSALCEGRIVRLGDIADDKLSAEFNHLISLDEIVDRLSADLRARIAQLRPLQSALEQEMREIEPVLARFHDLDQIQGELRRLEDEWEAALRQQAELRAQVRSCDSRVAELSRKLKQAEGLLRIVHGNPQRIKANLADEVGRRATLRSQLLEIDTRVDDLGRQWSQASAERERLQRDLANLDRSALEKQAAEASEQQSELGSEIRKIESEIAGLPARVVSDARILGTTGTRAYLSFDQIGSVDLVIVDEASMMLIPLVWLVAGMSSQKVVLCGDFRQLPPILQSEDPTVLAAIGGDVFHAAGMNVPDRNDRRIVMLDTQRRMDERICALISGPMYGGRLRTTRDRAFRQERKERRRPPAPFNSALTVIDTSDLHPIEAFDGELKSRLNMTHALLVRNLAWHFAQKGYLTGREDMAVCSPYAAQTKLIRKLLESESLSDVQVGTVHAFQGDERNAIVLEIPESEGSSKLGRFVTGVPPDDTGARLINVAVSRAENHLLVIANLAHLDRLLPANALLRSVLHEMELHGRVIPGKQLLALGPLEKDLHGLEEVELSERARTRGVFNQHDFDGAFAADVGGARKTLAIFSGFVSHNRVDELTRLLGESTRSGVKVRCISRPPHTNSTRPLLGKKALDKLEEIGCAVDARERIHQKVIIIDGQVVWHGSLNPLSYSQRTDEIMVRLVNADIAQIMAAALAKMPVSFSNALEKVADPENPRCEACGSRTYYHVQRRIESFTCENRCGWRVALSELQKARRGPPDRQPQLNHLPPTGEPCPKCGAQTLKRTSAFGPFYGCSRYPQCSGKWSLRNT